MFRSPGYKLELFQSVPLVGKSIGTIEASRVASRRGWPPRTFSTCGNASQPRQVSRVCTRMRVCVCSRRERTTSVIEDRPAAIVPRTGCWRSPTLRAISLAYNRQQRLNVSPARCEERDLITRAACPHILEYLLSL